MKMKKAFTLVELLVGMAILLIMIGIVIGTLNPIALVNKARDAQRKKDLSRIKVAFEDYYNDKGCYPNQVMVTALNDQANCGNTVFSPWLNPWPCDPNSSTYTVIAGDDVNCPKWYKVMVKLENTKDPDIPADWQSTSSYKLGGTVTTAMVNYGVSSSNIDWSDEMLDSYCTIRGSCYMMAGGVCNSAGTGCVGPNCYIGDCQERCRVKCCGVGCN